MTLTIDPGSVYVWIALAFFAIIGALNLVLSIVGISLKRKLLKKKVSPSLQLVTALQLVDQVAVTLDDTADFIHDEVRSADLKCHVKRVRRMAARLKSDAGLEGQR